MQDDSTLLQRVLAVTLTLLLGLTVLSVAWRTLLVRLVCCLNIFTRSHPAGLTGDVDSGRSCCEVQRSSNSAGGGWSAVLVRKEALYLCTMCNDATERPLQLYPCSLDTMKAQQARRCP